jgi:deazaflavin-dependent oxidoreductase (nitroreductase family)
MSRIRPPLRPAQVGALGLVGRHALVARLVAHEPMLAQCAQNGPMPLPHWLTRVNLAATNRLTLPLAGWLPWFGVLEHVGRRSGVVRRTPLNVFASGEGRWVVALTYGPGVQWLRNIEAAGECRMLIRGRWLRLVEPRRVRDPRRQRVPAPVRAALWVLRVDWFVELREAGPQPG